MEANNNGGNQNEAVVEYLNASFDLGDEIEEEIHYESSLPATATVSTLEVASERKVKYYDDGETKRMTRNILMVSFGFLFLFTAYNGVTNLQSSLYQEDGLGTYAMATVYIALVISSLFLPSWLMSKISVKWSIVLSMFCYTGYMGAQFHPKFETLLPAAAIVGLGAAPLWISKCTYLTVMANEYASITGRSPSEIIVRYFGIFFCIFQSSQIVGNLISSTIFSSGEITDPYNTSVFLENKCGANLCPCKENCEESTSIERDTGKIHLFFGICMGCAFAAILLVAFIDSLARYGEDDEEVQERLQQRNLLVATFVQMKNPYQILIIPLTIFSGLEQGFLTADYSQAYITCAYGVHNVGYVLITSGACDAVMSLGFGWLVKYTGRMPVFALGCALNIALMIVLLTWRPTPEESHIFFILAGLWGTADAIWQTQINAFYGAIFPQNEMSAFSNYRLWESIGFIISYLNSNLLCVRPKIYIMTAMVLLGMLGYFIIEFSIRNKNKRKGSIAKN